MAEHVTQTKVWRNARLGNSDLLLAQNLSHSFPRHTHDQYAIGVIEQGALGYFYRGEHVVAAEGDINLCIPGEVHTGYPVADPGWTYRMFYFDVALLQQVASEVVGRPRQLPYFRSGVIRDIHLAGRLRHLHKRLEIATIPDIELDTMLMSVLGQLMLRHADDYPQIVDVGQEQRIVAQVKEYLENHYAEEVTLDDLVRLTHLSRYHLIRVFSGSVGVPPHAYLRQVRIRRAKEQLARGAGITDVALAAGFTDQSHLTRWFKRLWGITPAVYRNSVQDTSF